MSKDKRPRFGEGPTPPKPEDQDAAGRFGAPLPLVTQPMIAVGNTSSGVGPMVGSPRSGPVTTQQISSRDSAQAMSDAKAMDRSGGDDPRRPRPTPAADGPLQVPGRSNHLGIEEISRGGAEPLAITRAVRQGGELQQHGAQPLSAQARQAPQIGLTQHHLPDGAPPDPRLVLVTEPDSSRAASYRVLRHHILEVGRPQVIVVSSPKAGDGKTTCAVNLALALAECGRAKVLLVEAHTRRPQLASLFMFEPPWCFAEQLAAHRHQPMLPWGFVDIPQLWLHVAAINPRIEHNQLLDAPAFAIAMDRLRLAGYDHIVIDCPPVVGSADVNLIQDASDGTLLVIRGKRTTARDLRQAIEQLNPTRVLGTVLMEA